MKKTLILALAIAGLFSGCESTPHYNRTKIVMMEPALPKKPYGSVKLFENKEDAPKNYDVIAIMTLQGDAGDEAQFMKAFLYRAADVGADGLIFYRGQDNAVLQPGWFAYGYWSPAKIAHERAYRGEAIHFK
jgi:hypothetical protein